MIWRYSLIASLLGMLIILGCDLFTEPQSDSKTGLGGIEGDVKNPAGQAITDALVTVTPSGKTTLTSNSGSYIIGDLQPGTYTVSARKDGFQTSQYSIEVIAGENSPASFILSSANPVLRTDPLLLDFGTQSQSLPLQIINDGEGVLNWQIAENVSWIESITPALSGRSRNDSSAVVTVHVDRSSLPEGRTTNNISIGSNAGAVIVSTVITKGAFIEASTENLDFGTEMDQLFFTLKNGGEGTINYTISTTAQWLSVSPGNGTLGNQEDIIEVNVNRTGLPYRTYYGRIIVNSGSGTLNIDVRMVEANPNQPQLSLSSRSLDFGDALVEFNLEIANSGVDTLNWDISENLNWLSVSSAMGSSVAGQPSVVTFTVDRANRNPGVYEDQVIINSNDPNALTFSLDVRMLVEDVPVLALSETELNFGRTQTNLSFEITNSGTGQLTWNVVGNRPWITFNPPSGDNQGTVNVTVNRPLAGPGNHSGQIDVTSNAGAKSVLIYLENRSNNTSPTANFSVDPLIGEVATVFSMDASASSDDFDPVDSLDFRWKWDASSDFGMWSNSPIANHQYSNTGTKFITLEVRDVDGAVGTISKSVSIIQNQPPSAAFLVNPLIGTLSTLFEFDARQSTDDITSTEDLEVRWQWENGSSFTAWTTDKQTNHQYGVIGQKQVVLEVRDESGLVSSTSRTIQVGSDPVQEVEPNDTRGQANSFDVNSVIYCEIGVGSDDKDWFEIVAPANGKLWFEIDNVESAGASNARIDRSKLYVINGFDQIELANAGIYHSGQYYIAPNETATSAKAVVSKDIPYYILVPQYTTHSAQYILRVFFEEITQTDLGEPNNQKEMAAGVIQNQFYQGHVGFTTVNGTNLDGDDWYEFTFNENGFAQFLVENLHTEPVNNGRIDVSTLYGATTFDFLSLVSASIYHSGYYYIGPQETATSSKAGIDKGRRYYLNVPQYDTNHAAPYEFTLSFIPISTVDFGEVNDDRANSTSVPVGSDYDALIGYAQSNGLYDEADWYTPSFSQHGLIKFTVTNLFPTGINDGRIAPCRLYVRDDLSLQQLDLLQIYHSGSGGGYYIGSGEVKEGLRVAVATSEDYHFSVEQFQRSQAPYNVDIEFIPLSISDVLEPNDSLDIAAQIPVNISIDGISIGYGGDNEDWYAVIPPQDGSFQFSVENTHIAGVEGGRIEPCILYDTDGTTILAQARIYHGGSGGGYYIGPDETASTVVVPLIANQTYYIKVPRWQRHVAPYKLQTSFSP